MPNTPIAVGSLQATGAPISLEHVALPPPDGSDGIRIAVEVIGSELISTPDSAEPQSTMFPSASVQICPRPLNLYPRRGVRVET